MPPTTDTRNFAHGIAADGMDAALPWRMAGIALLSVRVIQGFIYWGGGSRRFIYGPQKLNPHAPHWMANKFQSALPGAILGTSHIITFLLHHFVLLYAGLVIFSAIELVSGAMLIAGLMTRVAAAVTIGLSVVLMAMFGWQGATCIDEWTMAACNAAMGATLMLGGASAFSLDNVLLRRYPHLQRVAWFRWMGGSLPLPLSARRFQGVGLAVLAAVVIFDVGTYSYYRGSVLTPFHSGPVSPTTHHLSLTDVELLPSGAVRMTAYVDAGTPEAPMHIMQIDLMDSNGNMVASLDEHALSALPKNQFDNDFVYNRILPGPFGLLAPVGAKATFTLPVSVGNNFDQIREVRITDASGHQFIASTGVEHSDR